jgi:hypothetical protein
MRLFVLSATLLAALAAVPPAPAQAGAGEYDYTAEGRVERAPGGRYLTWDTAGRVVALNPADAEVKANAAIGSFLQETYPGFREVPNTRKVRVRPAVVARVGPNHTTFRLNVSCLAYVRQEKSVLTIFNWDVITEEVVTDRFTVRVLVSHDGQEQRFETDLRTIGRGKPGEMFRTFNVWAGDFINGDPPLEFTVRVLQKALPDLGRFATPPKPNPADPNDGFVEVGSFRVRLSHRDGRMVADWIPVAHATTPNRPRPGPGLLSQQFVLKRDGAVPFAVSAFAVKEADARAARDAALAAELDKQEEMRRKLGAAGPGIKVFTGSAQGKSPDARGREGTVGIGRLVILSADRAAAEAYAAREFRREVDRNAVVIAATEDEAKAALRAAFSKTFPKGRLEGEPRLTLKTGRTVMDRIGDLPPRPRRPRP